MLRALITFGLCLVCAVVWLSPIAAQFLDYFAAVVLFVVGVMLMITVLDDILPKG